MRAISDGQRIAAALTDEECAEVGRWWRGVLVTHRLHERTDTAIDLETGQAGAAVLLRFFSEPN